MKEAKDGVYRKAERSQEDIKDVKGISVINHQIRLSLGLSLREYVLLDFICAWHKTNKEPITYRLYWTHTGIVPRMIVPMFQKMKAKGLLFKDLDGKVKTTALWNEFFNSNGPFEKIWAMHRVGNKQKAKVAFLKALKVDTAENIEKGVVRYIEYVKVTDQFPAHLSTFLNHKNKMWQDEMDPSKYEKKKPAFQQPVKAVTGPKSAL